MYIYLLCKIIENGKIRSNTQLKEGKQYNQEYLKDGYFLTSPFPKQSIQFWQYQLQLETLGKQKAVHTSGRDAN